MRKVFVSVVALALVIALIGCATVPVKSNLNKTVSLTDMKGNSVRSFNVRYRAVWLLWGAMPLNVPEIDVVIGSHVADRTGVQNLKVEPKFDIIDIVATVLTLGVVTAKTVSISGEVYDSGVRSGGGSPNESMESPN